MYNDLDLARKEADASSKALGISIEITGVGEAEARVEVTAEMINGFAVCHGGHIFTLADTAFAFACNAYDRVTFAGGATIDFLRPAMLGDQLLAVAKERHRGGRSGVYDVSVTNQEGAEVAVFSGRSVATRETILSS
jgi:acyl-CoA thioesterase